MSWHVVDDPNVNRCDGKPGFTKLSIRTFSNAREKKPEQTSLGDLDRSSTVSRAYRCDHHVALARKPKCGVTKFDHGKVASRRRVKRKSMIHHNEWKRTAPAPTGPNQIGAPPHMRSLS